MSGWGEAVAQLLKLVNSIFGRRTAHKDKPETKNAERREQVENEILKDDEAAANARVDDDLFKLRMHRNAQAKNHIERSTDQTREG